MTDYYRVTILETSDEEVGFAIGWHSGQSSPLYSVASCGDVVRYENSVPYPFEDSVEQELYILENLARELRDCDCEDDPEDADIKASWIAKIDAEIRRRLLARLHDGG